MSWYSILPPLIAIVVVFWRKEVILALVLALISSEFLLVFTANKQSVFVTFINSIERIIEVATSAGNSRILVFSIVIGALLAFIRESGGVSATVNKLMDLGVAKSRKQVGILTMFTGTAVFIESNMSVLTSGIVARGLFDKFKMSRARLAYIIDSTSAPVCTLILLNGWGAFVLGLLSNYELGQSAVSVLWGSVAFNFYAIIALMLVFYTVVFDKVHGPMKGAEDDLKREQIELGSGPQSSKARFMLLPLGTLIIGMIGFMFWTGDGVLAHGSGSKSVLYATTLACSVAYLLLIIERQFTHHQLVDIGFKGMGELLPLVSIVLLSLTLGASLKELGTGVFVAKLVGAYLPIYLIVPAIFLTGAMMSFTTGTSWGTFAILIPIGVPLIQTLGLPPSLVVGAILSGGVFGDHCSPISDTTAVSALASGCDLLTHVKTQLPYALTGGALALTGFIVAGFILL
ncbi:Na+/H+ antiporter NhaC family protein [Pseudoalteromonas luteoviolacea]|uniref:Sodium:proton antiporter n=1 Tax=Pseudoalteromonas luteoviolacea S4054 TaxID=1129367 RepID=A0A0F6AHI8_9GAMM|nr:Na+/H+ antiporter NhaC family protein [Pseudoalteromonas luteoviolacea]AOT07283.1 sodium:proton antiporter [Pseudoalteromonas luteoviolacea]AOT12198.1 sodium:proton antiporter [Pseudoalteromonas luteoviolacea]AOT17111.1 sodium:proton antiporter [Pseudoalteromonas luteoviolacea]KKE85695.1 sodium:proton antiporter [Pseudoalteromonas luteoviolacea S4054]KZN70966.1 sodium:proton antiporter [Pseudoalteromonas luteoviolacea S4047-1]